MSLNRERDNATLKTRLPFTNSRTVALDNRHFPTGSCYRRYISAAASVALPSGRRAEVAITDLHFTHYTALLRGKKSGKTFKIGPVTLESWPSFKRSLTFREKIQENDPESVHVDLSDWRRAITCLWVEARPIRIS